MPSQNLIEQNIIPSELQLVKELVYDKCGFEFANYQLNSESKEYGACSFMLNNRQIVHRVSKITPTKTGQFVTIWKRNTTGITVPFNFDDAFDFIIITSRSGENLVQFIFPKSTLAEKEIITVNDKLGKRGIRVYPPWDKANSKLAEKTQSWQTKYFVHIDSVNNTNTSLIKQLLSNS